MGPALTTDRPLVLLRDVFAVLEDLNSLIPALRDRSALSDGCQDPTQAGGSLIG